MGHGTAGTAHGVLGSLRYFGLDVVSFFLQSENHYDMARLHVSFVALEAVVLEAVRV